MRKSILFVPVAAATVLIALTACEPAKQGAINDSPAGNVASAPAEVPAGDVASPPASDPATTETGTAGLGTGVVSYDDGITVSVSKVIPQKFSYDYGSGVAFTVTVTNNSGKAFDADMLTVDVNAGTEGNEAEAMFDSNKGFEGGISGKIANGRKASGKYGYKVAKADFNIIDVEVAIDWDHDSALFSGKVG